MSDRLSESTDVAGGAAEHNLSRRTIYRLIARGLPISRTSPRGKILISRTELREFLGRQAAQPSLDQMVNEVMNDLTHSNATRARTRMASVKYERGFTND